MCDLPPFVSAKGEHDERRTVKDKRRKKNKERERRGTVVRVRVRVRVLYWLFVDYLFVDLQVTRILSTSIYFIRRINESDIVMMLAIYDERIKT